MAWVLQAPQRTAPLAYASGPETARVLGTVVLPLVAQGAVVRRRPVTAIGQWLGSDRRAARLLARLREKHGPGLLLLRVPGRSVAVALSGAAADAVLADSPDPFALATKEKAAALRHFQPHGVLISTGHLRARRRDLNDAALESGRPVHHHGQRFAEVVTQELDRLTGYLHRSGDARLSWDELSISWGRIARRIVLGDGAADDYELTDLLTQLRRDANWAYAKPRRDYLRRRFDRLIGDHLGRAEPGSLASMLAAAAAPAEVDAAGQIPHWLFAFDSAGMTVLRTVSVLATHPHEAAHARADAARGGELPYLRACVEEAVRLWPTTLAILRETTRPVRWPGGTVPAHTTVVLVSSALNREATGPDSDADSFRPRRWLDGSTHSHPGFVPFSAGAGLCPGRDVVLHTGAHAVARLLRGHTPVLVRPAGVTPSRPLPATLDHYGIRLELRPRSF